MKKLLHNIRFYILCFSVGLSVLLYFVISAFNTLGGTYFLIQLYAFTGVIFLYTALLIGPILHVFPHIRYKNQINKARRAIGVSAFYFGCLHGILALFIILGGPLEFLSLDPKTMLFVSMSIVALIILFALAATSFDAIIRKMKFKNWKMLHRLIYIAAMLILFHSIFMGSHFADWSSVIPLLFFMAYAFLLYFEARRIDVFLRKKISYYPKLEIITIVFFLSVVFFFIKIFTS